VAAADDLSLLPLPTGSPELNSAEQVWQQLRDRNLANRCFDSYDQIVDACWVRLGTLSPESRAQFIPFVRATGLTYPTPVMP
jgi:transposase